MNMGLRELAREICFLLNSQYILSKVANSVIKSELYKKIN